MALLDASRAGTFRIGGEIEVNRLGFGAMRLTGPGVWGEPADRDEALRVLRRVPEIGINFVDTADVYGPGVSERLVREVLAPYRGMLVATKAGLTSDGPNRFELLGDPDRLIRQAHASAKALAVEQIGLWQLHRIDPKFPALKQFEAVRSLLKEGTIRHAGLSEVSVEDIVAASRVFPVATVQNRYNILDRRSEAVLGYCEDQGIGFIPWFPLGAGELTRPGSLLDRTARKYGATTGQIALAWLLKRSPVMLPIPGTSKTRHLEENVAALNVELTPEDFASLDRATRPK
jgi:pyridoxine 4-dehydrogenase